MFEETSSESKNAFEPIGQSFQIQQRQEILKQKKEFNAECYETTKAGGQQWPIKNSSKTFEWFF